VLRNTAPPIVPKVSNPWDTSNFRNFDDVRFDMEREHGLTSSELNASDPFRDFESGTPCGAAWRALRCSRALTRPGRPSMPLSTAVSFVVPDGDSTSPGQRRAMRSGLAMSTGDLRILTPEETAALMKEHELAAAAVGDPVPLTPRDDGEEEEDDDADADGAGGDSYDATGTDDDSEYMSSQIDLDALPAESIKLTGGDS